MIILTTPCHLYSILGALLLGKYRQNEQNAKKVYSDKEGWTTNMKKLKELNL